MGPLPTSLKPPFKEKEDSPRKGVMNVLGPSLRNLGRKAINLGRASVPQVPLGKPLKAK